MNPLRLYPTVLFAAAVAAAGAAAWMRRHRKTPEELERERRAWLNRNGRITDGNITDVQEVPTETGAALQMLIYQYDIAGVSYEASQDVTYLTQHVDLHSCRLSLPASIKYDPHNPGNSIVIAEGWSGLRKYPARN
jgi:predicted aconitase